MHVLSTWNVPSAVYHSARLGKQALVIAKSNRIEVVKLAEDGLRHICGIDLWGQITSLNVLNDNDESDVCVQLHRGFGIALSRSPHADRPP